MKTNKSYEIMNYKFDGSKVYFTSDTHFNHANIIGFCDLPFKDVNEMNETLIANWNRVVGADDIVFHLGDFCFGNSTKRANILNRLNGKIYLILGNHDIQNLKRGCCDRFESIVNILIGLNWQMTNGRRFTKLQVLRVAVGCAGDSNMTAKSIRKKRGGLSVNQWSR